MLIVLGGGSCKLSGLKGHLLVFLAWLKAQKEVIFT